MDSRPGGLAIFRPLITLLSRYISSDMLLLRTMIINTQSMPANAKLILQRALNRECIGRNGKTSFCSLASVPDWSEAKHCFGEWNASCVTSSAGDLSWALMKPCRPYMCLNVDAVISALCGISEENQQCQDANWKWDRRSRLEAERTAKTLEMSSRSRVVR